ncbi:predicted protein [Chaetomium globosum CBS 148.51]|uniref:Uncharacterized protein n=1 Tax=Chaetomium globosum (strain ATCC 6205 / CBS 148.51 / DSM 1962 / NBRC 6347 / NRRL 1970) TaxID=306901 RepID=Q2GUF5_CHAGB|nr:uncharacterized protein CHGG_08399 [Chaetomium globosum CBS 148.51]EAQ84385.1 predicted protein [Chaetomium globosum CBS 148.51]
MQTSSNEEAKSNTSNTSKTSNNKSQSDPNKPSPALVRWFAEKPGEQPFSGLAGVTIVKGNPSHGEEAASPLGVELESELSCDLDDKKCE